MLSFVYLVREEYGEGSYNTIAICSSEEKANQVVAAFSQSDLSVVPVRVDQFNDILVENGQLFEVTFSHKELRVLCIKEKHSFPEELRGGGPTQYPGIRYHGARSRGDLGDGHGVRFFFQQASVYVFAAGYDQAAEDATTILNLSIRDFGWGFKEKQPPRKGLTCEELQELGREANNGEEVAVQRLREYCTLYAVDIPRSVGKKRDWVGIAEKINDAIEEGVSPVEYDEE